MKKLTVSLLILGLLICTLVFPASAASSPLTFTLLKDGSGYEITGCDSSATVVIIPATHEGLPVKSVADRAFTGCKQLKMFIVKTGSEYFYAEDGVLFTDDPVKTLVRFPNNWKIYELSAYQVPEGTEAIAPWAFSGINTLAYLHIPEGVTTLGDFAFAESTTWYLLRVYMPDSLVNIGKNLYKNLEGYTAWIANPDSDACQYAKKNKIQCEEYIELTPKQKSISEGEADLADTAETKFSEQNRRLLFPTFASEYIGDSLQRNFDLSSLQEMHPDEVFVPVERCWPSIIPDAGGKTDSGYPACEGLFGVGYTEGETILRGYNAEGEVTGVRKVDGSFIFMLPDAVSFGCAGGMNTHISLTPYTPVIVTSPGILPLNPDEFRDGGGLSDFRTLILDYPDPFFNFRIPLCLDIVSIYTSDPFGPTDNSPNQYRTLITLSVKDPYLQNRTGQISCYFHSSDKSLETGQMTFSLLKDKSGYEISSCTEDAVTAVIPATYEGLPVKAVADKAFLDCTKLEAFVVESDSEYFYAEDGILFTDDPVKTLVRFPNYWKAGKAKAYQLPKGTKAIARWAFSGCSTLDHLHIPEGFTTLEDYAFAGVLSYNFCIYAPDSLTIIGKNLTQNATANIAVYANKGAAMLQYARKHRMPCQAYWVMETQQMTVPLKTPDTVNAEDMNPPDPEQRATVYIEEGLRLIPPSIAEIFDLSSLQESAPSEIYIPLYIRWPMLQPGTDGKTASGYPVQDGLFGVGYTEGETILRGYDLNGNITGTRKVNGDFGFALPGAVSMGVSGGSNTHLNVVPYTPEIITGPGIMPLSQDAFRRADDILPFKVIALEYTSPEHSFESPDYLNTLSSCTSDAFNTPDGRSGHYTTLVLEMKDPYLLDRMNQASLHFHQMETIFENKDITFKVSPVFGELETDLGEKAWKVFLAEKEMMEGVYYPAGAAINHITLLLNGCFPCAYTFWDGVSFINLDEQCIPFSKNAYVFTHEMIHAIDQSLPNTSNGFVPSPWMEGRAEYLGYKAFKALKLRGNSEYPKRYNWSFLTEEDKADFFRYYYESTNRETTYPVGYYFFKYLCDTYGEDISAKIMENIANARFTEYDNKAALFKECITSVTDPDVFQNFVRDVIH